MVRLARILLTALAALVFFALPAGAGGYTPPSIEAEVLANGDVRVTGSGCTPGSTVTITVDDNKPARVIIATATVIADENGNFTYDFTPPGPGTYTITATCTGPDGETIVQSTTITVPGPGTSSTTTSTTTAVGGGGGGGGDLPKTGSDPLPLARLGVILVGAGGVALYAGNKRRQKMTASA